MNMNTQSQLNALARIIEQYLTEEDFQKHGLNSSDIITQLELTQTEFCPTIPIEQVWEQEKDYFKQHGMTAFNCGYASKKLA